MLVSLFIGLFVFFSISASIKETAIEFCIAFALVAFVLIAAGLVAGISFEEVRREFGLKRMKDKLKHTKKKSEK